MGIQDPHLGGQSCSKNRRKSLLYQRSGDKAQATAFSLVPSGSRELNSTAGQEPTAQQYHSSEMGQESQTYHQDSEDLIEKTGSLDSIPDPK